MTRKEIVERAITFNRPPRLPLKFDVVGVNDCYDVWTHDPTGWSWSFEGRAADEWGCVWERTAVQNTGQVVGHPLRDRDDFDAYRWPDPDEPARYRDFEEQLAGADDRFVMFCFGHGIFERLHMLGGLSEVLVDLYRRPQRIHALVERILDHHLRVFRRCVRIADGRMHGAAMADDWGLQDRGFINVEMFRTFFKPRYQRWFDEIKAAGLHPWMHSCGHVNELIEELIDCGLEVINLQQPNVVSIDEIARRRLHRQRLQRRRSDRRYRRPSPCHVRRLRREGEPPRLSDDPRPDGEPAHRPFLGATGDVGSPPADPTGLYAQRNPSGSGASRR